jgi:hypothetical protein
MTDEKTQQPLGVASDLNAELDKRLYYVEPVALKHKKTGNIKLCRVFSWRDDDGRLHHDYFSHNQQPTKIIKALVSGGYSLPLNRKGLLMTASQLKKEMFSCAVGLVV